MRNTNNLYICPTCHKGGEHLIDWEYSGLNESVFNYTVKFCKCKNCGLVWVSNITDEVLSKFYTQECFYFDSSHFDVTASENIKKYEYYRSLLEEFNLTGLSVVDVGCGRGGFVSWLMKNNWQAVCCGVDVDLKSFSAADNELKPVFIEGSAVSLPFENSTQSILTYFHVFEHIIDINKVLQEANRALKNDGYLILEVPDAQGYKDCPINTCFWPSIREHIYHFSPNAFISVLNNNGFEVKTVKQKILSAPEFKYPSLAIVAQKNGKKNIIENQNNIDVETFFLDSFREFSDKAQNIKEIMKNYDKIIFWGISSQLLSFLPLLKNDLDKIKICDMSMQKQKATYRGMQIENPSNCYEENSCLIISSYLYRDSIKKSAQELGWKEEDIFDLI